MNWLYWASAQNRRVGVTAESLGKPGASKSPQFPGASTGCQYTHAWARRYWMSLATCVESVIAVSMLVASPPFPYSDTQRFFPPELAALASAGRLSPV